MELEQWKGLPFLLFTSRYFKAQMQPGGGFCYRPWPKSVYNWPGRSPF
jgi:hypothetical protein